MGHTHTLVVIILVVAEGPGAVALIVGLVDDIESELVTELIEIGNIRIVAGPDSVEIVLFDHEKVPFNLRSVKYFPCDRIRFMPVHTAELDWSSVQVHDTVLQTDTSEADPLGDRLVVCLDDQCVEVRCFSIPEERIFDSQMYLRLSIQRSFENRPAISAVSRGLVKLKADRDTLPAKGELDAEIRCVKVF